MPCLPAGRPSREVVNEYGRDHAILCHAMRHLQQKAKKCQKNVQQTQISGEPAQCLSLSIQIHPRIGPGPYETTARPPMLRTCRLDSSSLLLFLVSCMQLFQSFRCLFWSSSSSTSWLAVNRLRARAFSLPFFTWMLQPCSFRARVRALLGRIPGKSFAV